MAVMFGSIHVVALVLLAWSSVASGVLFGRHAVHPSVEDQSSGYNYNVSYFNVQVDHFGFENADMFPLRYLTNVASWDSNGGPIFLYAGNEGDITWFCNNTGFMWDIAPEFHAMLVFAEHRYYGDSMPFGKDSFKDSKHLDLFTSEQALADFAAVIDHLKTTVPGASNSPVVAFGGSYGGMLAAWLRMKYPSAVIGSLAASAPIWQFTGLTPCSTQARIITKDFEDEGIVCRKNIRRSWDIISDYGKTEPKRQTLSKALRLCSPVKNTSDVQVVIQWLTDVWFNLAMVNYPYAASFLEPLPGNPIKEVCSFINKSDATDEEILIEMAAGLNVYFNYTGAATCFNTSQTATGDLGNLGWGYQACTEMVMPYCSDGVNDMFPVVTYDEDADILGCQKGWNVTPRPKWIQLQYGGKDITAASNIIFSNGLLDPWSAGGVLKSLSDSLVAIVIPDGAHHLDLRAKNKNDPPALKQAREMEKDIIGQWVHSHYYKLKTKRNKVFL